MASEREGPYNPLVSAMLTDLYQISMAYAYWNTGKHESPAVFDLFFRKNPFKGEFTVFEGVEESLRHVATFGFSETDIAQLRDAFPTWKPGFWDWLATADCSNVKIYAIPAGTVVFPREPLMRIEGPLAVCQLLETTLLVLVNYASLVTTNAARHRLAAGPEKNLLEFGLRRAQGPDGAMSASRYTYVGGFDGTSNVKAALDFGMTMKGTHAHSFVVSFTSLRDLGTEMLQRKDSDEEVNIVTLARAKLRLLGYENTNEGELAAFIAYAQAYPDGFLALVDTYDTLNSGLQNFLAVALALVDLGYTPRGIRLDSGDLAYLSKQCRKAFIETSERFDVSFEKLNIVASNDLSESVIYALNEQKHEIDSFGIGTNLVTCKMQPALGCVYKLVEIDGHPRIKLSQDVEKVTIPGKKDAYRLYNKNGRPVIDLLVLCGHQVPTPQSRTLCRHPFDANKRAYVTPARVEKLHKLVWDGALTEPHPSLAEVKERVKEQLRNLREDHLRRINPTPYKLALATDLYQFMHDLWLSETPIRELD